MTENTLTAQRALDPAKSHYDDGEGEIDRRFAVPLQGERVFNIDPPSSPNAIMRRAAPLPRRKQWTRREQRRRARPQSRN